MLFQVNQFHIGKQGTAETRRQLQMLVFARLRIQQAFKRWRRRRQGNRKAANLAAHHCHIPRIIRYALILLEGGFMFFIHHNQPKIGKGQKQGRTRADNNLRPPLDHVTPVAPPLSLSEIGMPFHRPRPEARLKPAEPLCGKRNFRQQNKRLPTFSQAGGKGLEINLCFAGPGHAVDQGDGKLPLHDIGRKGIRRRLLIRRQVKCRMSPVWCIHRCVGRHLHGP